MKKLLTFLCDFFNFCDQTQFLGSCSRKFRLALLPRKRNHLNLGTILKSDSHLTYNRFETTRSQVRTDIFMLGKTCEEDKRSEGIISFRRKLNDIRGEDRGNHQEYSEPNGHVIDY